MTATPVPQIGPDLTYCVLYGITLTANGAWAGVTYTGSSYTVAGVPSVVIGVATSSVNNVIRHVNFVDTPEHAEINAMNRRARNQVIISDGANLDLQIYNVNNGNDPSPLFTFWYNYDYFVVQWIEGTVPGAIFTNSFLGVRGELDKPFEGRGEQMTTGHLLEVDAGTPQFTRYVSG